LTTSVLTKSSSCNTFWISFRTVSRKSISGNAS
jgi:hypothetical protein